MSVVVFTAPLASVAGYLALLRAQGRSDHTVNDRAGLLYRFGRDIGTDPVDATAEQVTTWLGREGWSGWTRSTYAYALRSYYRYLIESGQRSDDPMQLFGKISEPDDAPHPVPAELAREVLAITAGSFWHTVVLLARYAGLRVSEIAALGRGDLTVESILVRRGKGNKGRTIPTHPLVWAAVKDAPPGPLFSRPWGGEVPDGYWMTQRFRLWADRRGLPKDLHLHRFRHTFATTLLRSKEHGGAGASVRVVQKLMGHASMATTAKYLDCVEQELTDAIGGLGA